MGPAILLCPSSSAAHLWRQALPTLKPKQKEGSLSLSQRCSANAGDLIGRPAFFFYPASPQEKGRKYFTWRRHSAAAAASEVSVEEAASEVSVEEAASEASTEEAASEASAEEAPSEVSVEEAPSEASAEAAVAVSDAEQSEAGEPSTSSEAAPAPAEKTQARRSLSRSNSKKNITVGPAELVPGAQFSGKVVSIQGFGAFVDFGAFTNGLVHISRLSKSYVKKVEDVVQIGQDVKIQVLEVDFEANRISLMLVEEAKEGAEEERADRDGETQPQRASQQQTRAPRRDPQKRLPTQRTTVPTTLKKGEIVVGTVKNMIKSGVFLSLPDGTDGYLPVQEVIFKAPNTGLEAQFQVGEELTVRVLRVDRGRVNLTMKREVNYDKINEDMNKGVMGMATNPFELAFRRNEVIASYLAERDKQNEQGESVEKEQGKSVEEEQGESVKEAKEEEAAEVPV